MSLRYLNKPLMGAYLLSLILLMYSCAPEQATTDLTLNAIIPRPVSVEATGSSFTINEKTNIYISEGMEGIRIAADYLAGRLNPATGLEVEVIETSSTPRKGNIYLKLAPEGVITKPEGYILSITDKLVQLSAIEPAGFFHGIQTLLQILPAGIEYSTVQEEHWTLPTGIVRDEPRYAYRGAMLDVARHFFKPADVRRFIDLMARYKLNMLHLHLSDDQGWRIEIKSWPNLTLHGGSTQVGGGPGGFYTQEEYTELVKYAQSRFITIIPEIDMPGHTNAALASYAVLNCDEKAKELYTGTNVGFSSLCTSREITYKFIKDVMKELGELTPGPYLHIGGDESHSTKPWDYVLFIQRVQEIVESTGKTVMGWDDIATSQIKRGTICQHWASVENAVRAAEQGARLVLSPASKAYLDMKYDSTTVLGLKWAGYIEVDSAYSWNPSAMVPGIGKNDIFGIEAPLWTETVSRMEEVEFLTFPRLPGYAEIGWTPDSLRSWNEYKDRLARHGERFAGMGINFYRSPKVNW